MLLALIVLVSIGVRAVFAALPRVVRWDEAAYQLIARSLRAGLGYRELLGAADLQQPPVVAYLSAFGQMLRLSIPWATAGPVHVLLGGLLPLPAFGLAQRLSRSRPVAFTAAMLTAVHPALAVSPLYWSTMTEPPYTFFILCGLYATWEVAARGVWRWALAMGCAFGLAYLTRPEALAYLAVGLLFVLVYRLWPQRCCLEGSPPEPPRSGADPNKRSFWDKRFISTSALVFACLLIFLMAAGPYVTYLHRVTGRWIFSGKQGISMELGWAYVNNSQAMHDRAVASLDSAGQEIMWLSSEQFEATLSGWIKQNPGRFVTMLRTNLIALERALFHEDLFGIWTVALMVLGLFGTIWTRTSVRGHLLLILALIPLASTLPFFVLSRFLATVVPIGLIWAAMGLDHLAKWIKSHMANARSRRLETKIAHTSTWGTVLLALPIVVILTAYLWAGIGVAYREVSRQPFWRVQIADWIARNLPEDSSLVTRNSEIALYAGLPQTPLPNATWPKVLTYVQARGGRYLVVDDKEIKEIRPDLEALLDPDHSQLLPGLSLVQRLDGPPRTTWIYEIQPIKR